MIHSLLVISIVFGLFCYVLAEQPHGIKNCRVKNHPVAILCWSFVSFRLLASVQILSITLGQYFSILSGLEKYVFGETSV